MLATNPRTGEQDYVACAADPPEVAAEAALRRAGVARWQAMGAGGRAAALSAFARDLGRDAGLLAALIEDTGRERISRLEVAAPAALVDRYAPVAERLLREGAPAPSRVDGVALVERLVPYPLVGVIAPWNSPLGLLFIDAVPALLMGSAVLLKPSEVTPRFVRPLSAVIARHPEVGAVLALLPGDAATGEAVVDSVDAIVFTGSVETGRTVAARAARRLIPAFLELGGKDAAIVLEGADVSRAAAAILWSGTLNTGQLCHSTERVFVARGLHDALVSELARGARALRGANAGGPLGPFIHAPQAALVERHMRDAMAGGATALIGGPPVRDGGWWMDATVVTGTAPSMALMREETFGPVLPVMAFDTEDEAIALANDSSYGLSASVFGPEERALAVARRLSAGGVSINDASLPSVVQEGGKMAFGQSGLGGTRMGEGSLLRFARRQAFLINRLPGASPWWAQ